MKKILLVLAVLTLGAFASAQTWYFQNSTGTITYCNYEVFYVSGPWVAGSDVIVHCGASLSTATFVGFKVNLTAANNPAGFAVRGVVVGDDIYDTFALAYTGNQWTLASYWKKRKKSGGCVAPVGEAWVGVAGASGAYFGDNYGLLSCTPPTGPSNHIATIGQVAK